LEWIPISSKKARRVAPNAGLAQSCLPGWEVGSLSPDRRRVERRAWVHALTKIEKLDNLPHWLATNEPAETNRALHLLLASIIVSTETIELKFK